VAQYLLATVQKSALLSRQVERNRRASVRAVRFNPNKKSLRIAWVITRAPASTRFKSQEGKRALIIEACEWDRFEMTRSEFKKMVCGAEHWRDSKSKIATCSTGKKPIGACTVPLGVKSNAPRCSLSRRVLPLLTRGAPQDASRRHVKIERAYYSVPPEFLALGILDARIRMFVTFL